MSLNENGNGFYMPVAPAYAYGGNNGGFGFGGDWSWIILLVLLCGGGWGGFGGFGGGYGNMMLGYDFPWLLNGQNGINANTNAGFDHAATQRAIGDVQTAVTSGFGDVQTALCGGFAGVNASIANGFATAEVAENSRQMANMQQMFGLSQQLAQCCCDNRAATQDVKYTIATEACNTRAANTQNTQAILDKLCQLELDGYKRENDQLRSQLNIASLNASQVAQTAELRQSGATQLNQLVSELRNCPIPAVPVFGDQRIFTCNGNSGCGCNSGFAN